MDTLPPELVSFIAFMGVLTAKDALELACASKKLKAMVLGTEWHKSHVMALKPLRWICEFGNAQSARFHLETRGSQTAVSSSCKLLCLLLAGEHRKDVHLVLRETWKGMRMSDFC